MTPYEAAIVQATGCPEDRADEVEEVMRDGLHHGTLDHLSRAVFDREARKAWGLVQRGCPTHAGVRKGTVRLPEGRGR
jgi:hypothetical protein